MTDRKNRTIASLLDNPVHNGFVFEQMPHCGPQYFSVQRANLIEHVHVAIDGTIRYSDSERFGQIWSLGL